MARGATRFCVIFAALMVAGTASAAESWLQCDGTVVVTGGQGQTGARTPAKDIYATNDETRHLFKYSDARKTLDLVFVNEYGPKAITWSRPAGSTYGAVQWDGALDRNAMTLTLVRKERGEVTTWTETCKPIPPLG